MIFCKSNQRIHSVLALAVSAAMAMAISNTQASELIVTNGDAVNITTDPTISDVADIGLDHSWTFIPTGTTPSGTVNVGNGADVVGWTNYGELWIASNFNASSPGSATGAASVSVTANSTLYNNGKTYIGFNYYPGVSGTMDIADGANFNSFGQLYVSTHGSLTIEGTATQENGDSVFIQYASGWGGGGIATVQGANAVWNASDINVDTGGTSMLNVLDGGTINGSTAFVGNGYVAGDASAGLTSTWAASNYVWVGGSSGEHGALTVDDHGLVHTGRVFVGGSNYTGTLAVNSGGAVDADASQFFGGKVEMYAGSSIDLSGGGKMLIGYGDVNSVSAGTMKIDNGGTLKGEGTVIANVLVTGGGTISPGHSPGTITIDGNLALDPTGSVTIEIAGPGSGQFDVINVTGTTNFGGGQLILDFLNGYVPTSGDLIDLTPFSSTGGLSGTFGSIDVQGLPADLTADVDLNQLSAGQISFTTHAVPEPGSVAMLAIGAGLLFPRRRLAHSVSDSRIC